MRQLHGRERGLSLIEMIIAIFVISVGIVGIVSAFSTVVRTSGIAQDQAQLEAASRQLSDYIRSPQLPYVVCATAASAYPLTPLPQRLTPPPEGVSWAITQINVSLPPTHDGGPATTQPLRWCPASRRPTDAGPVGDWGVQEIFIKVTSLSRSLTRIVWKSDASSPPTPTAAP
jgi:prepilin-type N-terminal cleavage/methylation domain-containing protein